MGDDQRGRAVVIKLRHLVHPIHSAKGLYERIRTRRLSARTAKTLSLIQRDRRDVCWCGGRLEEFKDKPSYGICQDCGCYVNRTPPLEEDLKRLYSFRFYWHTMQRFRGHAVIEERPSGDGSDGRVEYWLSVIEKYRIPGKRVLEVGCAHALLLEELSSRGFECVGVEVDQKTAEWAQKRTGIKILSGIFPGVKVPDCDLFLAFDVLEHSISPLAFLKEVHRILSTGGVAVIQSPIDFDGLNPPFGEMFEKAFDDIQHLFVFSRKSIRLLAERAGLEFLGEDQWRVHHEIAVLRKTSDRP